MTGSGAGRARAPSVSGLRLPPATLRLAARRLGRDVLDPGLPFPAQRARLEKVAGVVPVRKGTAVAERVLDGVRAEMVRAGSGRPARTVIHFHGGGYCVGSPRMARPWAASLSAQAGCQVLVPDYRLAPEHPYPAALDDARTVMRALAGDIDPGSLVLSGDSAGGGLALSLVLWMRDAGQELPAGCILMSPWLDLGADRRSVPKLVRKDVVLSPGWLEACATAYARPADQAGPAVSPLLAEHGGLPPLLIQAGTDELLVSDADQLAVKAATAGVSVTYTRWPRMWHDFTLQPGVLAAADSALSQAAWFVRQVTGS